MSPEQLIRASGTLARLVGLEARHDEAVRLEAPTLVDVADLLSDVLDAIDAAIDRAGTPEPDREPAERVLRRRSPDPEVVNRALGLLALTDMTMSEAAEAVGLTRGQLRRARRNLGHKLRDTPRAPADWRALILSALSRGVTDPAAIAAETGYKVSSVREYLSRLRNEKS